MKKAGLLSVGIGGLMVAIGLFESRKRNAPMTPIEPVTPLEGDSVAIVARNELRRWAGLNERSPQAETILKEYWASTGQAYPGPDVAWSGAFVNWVIAHSDHPNSLLQSGAHIYYARKAYYDKGIAGRYGAFKPSEVEIEPGDIIVGSRPGGTLTFDDIAHGKDFIPTHGDIVTERTGETIKVIGGNVNDTVSERVVPVNSPHIVAVLRYQHEPNTPSA